MVNIRALAVILGVGALAGVGVGVGTASATATTHTLHLTALQLNKHQAGNHEVTASKDVQHGKVTGSDVVSCVVHVKSHTASCDAALARTGGLIDAHVTISLNTGKGKGTVTGGTRHFAGVTGTITVKPGSSPNATVVTVHYRV
jgi:hypothetical protein